MIKCDYCSLTHLGFSPVGLDAKEINRLMPDELLRSLLHDLLVIQRPNHFRWFFAKFLKNKIFFFYYTFFPPKLRKKCFRRWNISENHFWRNQFKPDLTTETEKHILRRRRNMTKWIQQIKVDEDGKKVSLLVGMREREGRVLSSLSSRPRPPFRCCSKADS